MPKANEKEAIIAVQRKRVLAIHLTSHTIITIIKTTTNVIHSNPNHLHSFIILDDDSTLPIHIVIWANSMAKFQASLSAWAK